MYLFFQSSKKFLLRVGLYWEGLKNAKTGEKKKQTSKRVCCKISNTCLNLCICKLKSIKFYQPWTFVCTFVYTAMVCTLVWKFPGFFLILVIADQVSKLVKPSKRQTILDEMHAFVFSILKSYLM